MRFPGTSPELRNGLLFHLTSHRPNGILTLAADGGASIRFTVDQTRYPMSASPGRPGLPPYTLSQALPNETVRIERILFQLLRDLCYGLGVAEGDVVRCRSVSGSVLLLETTNGRTVVMEHDWTRFIEIAPPDGGSARPLLETRAPAMSRPASWRSSGAPERAQPPAAAAP
jgi:hypothetical protein